MRTATGPSIVPATTYRAIVGQVVQQERSTRFTHANQKEFADQVGVSQATLSRIESGAVNFSVEQLKRIGDALGIAPSDLLRKADIATDTLRRRGVQIIQDDQSSQQALAFLGGAALAALLLATLGKK